MVRIEPPARTTDYYVQMRLSSAEEFIWEAGDSRRKPRQGSSSAQPTIRMEQRFGRTPSPSASEITDAHMSVTVFALGSAVEKRVPTVDVGTVST